MTNPPSAGSEHELQGDGECHEEGGGSSTSSSPLACLRLPSNGDCPRRRPCATGSRGGRRPGGGGGGAQPAAAVALAGSSQRRPRQSSITDGPSYATARATKRSKTCGTSCNSQEASPSESINETATPMDEDGEQIMISDDDEDEVEEVHHHAKLRNCLRVEVLLKC